MKIGELFFQLFQQRVAHQDDQVGHIRIAGGGVDLAAGSHAALNGLGKAVAVSRTDTDTNLFIFGPVVIFEHIADVILHDSQHPGIGGFDLRSPPDVGAIHIFHQRIHIGILFEFLPVDAGDIRENVTADHHQRMAESGDLHFVAQLPEVIIDAAVFVVNFPVLTVKGTADGKIRFAGSGVDSGIHRGHFGNDFTGNTGKDPVAPQTGKHLIHAVGDGKTGSSGDHDFIFAALDEKFLFFPFFIFKDDGGAHRFFVVLHRQHRAAHLFKVVIEIVQCCPHGLRRKFGFRKFVGNLVVERHPHIGNRHIYINGCLRLALFDQHGCLNSDCRKSDRQNSLQFHKHSP